MRYIPLRFTHHEMHAHEMRASEMQTSEINAHKVHAPRYIPREMHVSERCTRKASIGIKGKYGNL